ncbi:AzlC family ABC transporter permease [Clostridium felsineum]|uniref:AzlC family ABC transporter permease n=1 Tax=Clostridium felsineum TaxID=36839 RepID=UPI00098C9C6B|nr:AzlC family ABC transporter permease [Clostridium felsineum]URZ15262.1 hypothetical protein CLFE_012800 [Clostridium felsineum DSM 794]
MLKEKTIISEKSQFYEGIKDCMPTVLGYLSIGFACGVVSKASGLTILEIALMSIFVYAGSAQLVAAGMIASLASIPAVTIAIFFVNLRHLLMSASLAPYFKKNSYLKNFTVGVLMTDETFALAAVKGKNDKRIDYKWIMGANIIAYLNWLIATVLGAYFSTVIYDYKKFGLDFALPAMFIGLLVSSIKGNNEVKKGYISMAISAVIFILCVKFMSSNSAVMVAAILGAGVMIKKWI